MTLEAITIIGLFDRDDVHLDFRRSVCFLVGPNGTGKSTSLRIVYYLLTAQWQRLSEMPFVGLEITIAGVTHPVEKSDFNTLLRLRTTFRRIRRARPNMFPDTNEQASRLIGQIRPGSGASFRTASGAIIRSSASREAHVLPENYNEIAFLHNFIEENTRDRVLYYPTYRRVERDLSELFDTEDPFEETAVDLTPSIADRFTKFGEVVGFGGQDIKKLLSDAASKIENEARQALNEHSVRFLEAVAKPKAESTTALRKVIASPDKVEKILLRITSLSPSTIDVNQVEKAVRSLREKLSKKGMGRLTAREDILLYYIGELLKLTNRIDALSSELRNFAKLVESYFKPQKEVRLNDYDNTVSIVDKAGKIIDSDDLSSGEKQILAIFAFLILSDKNLGRFVIIDEPELSLSVGWQKALVSDIQKTGTPEVVLAATHSPFIIERFPMENVVSLGDI